MLGNNRVVSGPNLQDNAIDQRLGKSRWRVVSIKSGWFGVRSPGSQSRKVKKMNVVTRQVVVVVW